MTAWFWLRLPVALRYDALLPERRPRYVDQY